jgi:cysteine desulfurase
VEVVFLPVDGEGRLDLAALDAGLRKPTALVTLMLSNNETGVVFPVAEVARRAKAAGAQVHVDAVQSVGKIELDVEALGVDFLSLSAHKFHGPKGAGVLYVNRAARYRPLIWGAGHEGGRRAGTENVPGIVGLGVAAAHMARGIDARREHLARLSRLLEQRLLAIPDTRLNGGGSERMPGTVNVSFKGIEGSAIVLTVAREGVCLSAGSACSAAQFGGSHVLEAMGAPFEYLHGAVRFSCAESNTEADVSTAVAAVERAVRYLRSMDPAARRAGAAPPCG